MHRIGRSEEALALLRKALAGREAVLGPHHAESLATSSATAACLKSLGRHAEVSVVPSRVDMLLQTILYERRCCGLSCAGAAARKFVGNG